MNVSDTRNILSDGIWNKGMFLDKLRSPEGKGFKLALHKKNPDAPLSPFYLNLRLMQSFPRLMALTAELLDRMTQEVSYDLIAGIPYAGVPIATALSLQTGLPMITPRIEKKDHGAENVIDGVWSPGQHVLLIDDLITRADSKFGAINILEGAGLVVEDLAVIVDREQGGRQELEARNYRLHSIFDITPMLENYRQDGRLKEEVFQEIQVYRAAA